MKSLFLILILIFVSLETHALRISPTLYQSLFVSNDGFQIDPKNTSWVLAPTPNEIKNKVEAMYRMKTSTNSQPTLTVRVDSDTSLQTLQDYAQKWLKTYGQFGVEVLGYKYFKIGEDNKGLVIDTLNSSKKARQAIFFRNQKAIVLTCMDQKENFNKTIKDCNDIIKSFSWTDKDLKNPESTLVN